MASRKLEDLHPDLRPLCEQFIARAAARGVDVIITCTYRSGQEQDKEYARGRTVSSGINVTDKRPFGSIVTRAKAGQSAHNFTIDGKPASKAFDVVPCVNGRPVWDKAHPSWQVLGNIGVALGLNWYGIPGSKFEEYPHFQLKEST